MFHRTGVINVTTAIAFRRTCEAVDRRAQGMMTVAGCASGIAHCALLLRPTGIDHILVNVSNVEKSTVFYEKILGSIINPASRPRRTWFSGGGSNRVGLALAGPGQKPGIDHYCLTVPFDRASLAKAVEAAGAKIIQGDVATGIDFLDLNGIHVQVIPPARG